MKPSLMLLRPTGLAALLTGALAILLLAGCSTPVALADSRKPAAPITAPSLSGRLVARTAAPIATAAQLQQCLDSGLPAFGLTLENTNVRVGPSTDFCRVGKIASGAVVEIIDYVMITETVAAPAAPIATGPTIGYNEDIKPLFERSCSACHNAIAKTLGLQTTTYRTLMAGSQNGPVVVPGDPDASKLWEMVSQGKMPATGPLPLDEQALVRTWIEQGAAERRAPVARAAAPGETINAWYALSNITLSEVAEPCEDVAPGADYLVSADLIRPLTCGLAPSGDVRQIAARSSTARDAGAPAIGAAPAADATNAGAATDANAVAAPVPANVRAVNAAEAGIQAAAFGLPAPSDEDPYLTPVGFCIERRLADNNRGITAIAFAPDGRMFLALDSDLARDVDPLILYDAFHPSRAVAVYDYVNDMTPVEIMTESGRITGLDYADGALYVSRAGEVGRIRDGGSYETLAGGFKVQSQLFHANNGIEVDGGWVYVSAGGMRDGYVEGPIVGVSEAGAQDIVSDGSPFAARILRAPLSTLLSSRTIGAFTTAARGVRNPYGIAADPSGRIWFTDNGATNVPDEISAGDEVNVLSPGAIGGSEESTPYYGFPLALSGTPPDWYSAPVAALVNSAAPTGITWANGTVYFGVYGRNPGLYRLGRTAGGAIVAERIMMAWPVLAVETAPDGAIWVGMGNGNLFRMTPGC
jgi:glucose/arabinose dehydrogenase